MLIKFFLVAELPELVPWKLCLVVYESRLYVLFSFRLPIHEKGFIIDNFEVL